MTMIVKPPRLNVELPSGSAYVFIRDEGGTNNWGEVKKLIASDGEAYDSFGRSVSIDSDTTIIGSSSDEDNGVNSGSAYIFNRNEGGTNNWGEVKKLIPSDGEANNRFGSSVSINGDTAIVGAFTDNDKGEYSGSAYIFSRNEGGTNNWGELKKLIPSDGEANDWFGFSVSISDDTAIIGAHKDDNDDSGAAYIFSRNEGGTNNWGEVKKLIASARNGGARFGYSVSICGNTAVVGALGDGSLGSAYIFSRNEGGITNWGEIKKLTLNDSEEDDQFGLSVSINGDIAIIGTGGVYDNGDSSGSAYVFSRNEGGASNWGQVKKLIASDGETNDRFGSSMSIDGNTAIVGAFWDDDRGIQSGSAYIFQENQTLTITNNDHENGTVTSTPEGINCGPDCTKDYPTDTSVQLTASPEPGLFFGGWTGYDDCTDGHVTMDEDKICIATFTSETEQTLTIEKTGVGDGTVISIPSGINCGDECSKVYDLATVVSLTASADPGYSFEGFTGDDDCTDGQVTMNKDKTCIAIFTLPEKKNLTVTKSGTGYGTVTSVPEGIDCGSDYFEDYDNSTQEVTLIAVPDPGSLFVTWTGFDSVDT